MDWLGAALLFAGVSALLIALGGDAARPPGGSPPRRSCCWPRSSSSSGASPEPILPLDLLRSPLIARTLVVVFLVGMALFGAIAFIPLFVQGVMGGTATQAGQVLTPLFLGWVVMSIAARG